VFYSKRKSCGQALPPFDQIFGGLSKKTAPQLDTLLKKDFETVSCPARQTGTPTVPEQQE